MRKIIILLALIARLSPAFAQAPAPVPALPDAERRTSYSISGSTCACGVGFQLYGDSTDVGNWLVVAVNGIEMSQAGNWTITSPSGQIGSLARPITDAVLTFTLPQTGIIQILGAQRPRRLTEVSEGRGVAARDYNQFANTVTAELREAWDRFKRTPRVPPGETTPVLPPAASRANMGVCFDASGNFAVCASVPSSTFAAGSGITFTGTGPTTISTTTYVGGAGIIVSGSPTATITTDPTLIPTLGANSWTDRQTFSPALGGTAGIQSIGIFLTPTLGSGRTNNSFLTPYNMQWGTPTIPIPAGTLGSLDGYECNQNTSQNAPDASAAQGNHCFGATIFLHGGVSAQGTAITATMDTIAGVYFAHDVNLENNIAGGQMTGLFVNAGGSQKATSGVTLNGSFVNGAAYGNNNVVGVSFQTFVGVAFGSLPVCGVAVSSGSLAVITDSSVGTWGSNAAGGGVVTMLVYCNGANWTIAAK